ncbi:UDP-N-acetylmuramoyl-L-alanyl-D-glutamate--2,6-diaminopimelate ligase [SAR86 cluster bacterium]|nr:UDP-N-acetylmuramoyl-L-alanyl-D-glutamate--2,6-diaminopimelate ligase [SAR86 cluster bacterium]
MNIYELVPETKKLISEDISLNSISINSKEINKGDIFVSIDGSIKNRKLYYKEVVLKGAKVILTNLEINIEASIPIIFIKDLKERLSNLSNDFYNCPSKKIEVFGITGTNGKSSVASYLHQIMMLHGEKAGLISNFDNKESHYSKLTTPDVFLLNKIIKKCVEEKKQSIIFEVSSHAIHQKRVEGIEFDYGCLTSFSRDHLDYHGSINEYSKVKESFFEENLFNNAVINTESNLGKKIVRQNKNFISLSSLDKNADIYLEIKKEISTIHSPWLKINLPKEIFAQHSMMNIASSLGLFLAASETKKIKETNLKKLKGLPGRLELVKLKFDQSCYIDYAHTPEALKITLQSLRNKYAGALICIFGCGGERDNGKRSLMGEIAASMADNIIITNDNPRLENPEKISLEILKGIKDKSKTEVIYDRTIAIKTGLNKLKNKEKDSVLLIAGKGHESFQEISGKFIKSNDFDIIRSHN